jgi:hypothetical protein
MGYGPSTQNRFGWCWRNEHGEGIRMTPYFETEEIAELFHDYFVKNSNSYKAKQVLSGILAGHNGDLRLYSMEVVIEIAKAFAKEDLKTVIKFAPRSETMVEYYGCDMKGCMGFDADKEEEKESPKKRGKK